MKDYVVALIGRPNVGKSTLFNAILGSNDAITEKDPGITRDRKYGSINREGFRIILVDTGGYDTDETGIISKIREQTLMAITESDISIFVVDGRVGLMPSDEDVAEILRKHSKPVILAVNKIDNDDQNEFLYDFNKLGIKKIIPISASHRKNLTTLTDAIDEIAVKLPSIRKAAKKVDDNMKIAIVGQPNSGKSSLVNFLLGKKRMIVSEMPGTTRDSVDSEIKFHGIAVTLIDTAGLRRKAKVNNKVEVYSILRTIKSIERSDIVFLMFDIEKGLTVQDQKIAALVRNRQKCLLILGNKWDLVDTDRHEKRKSLDQEIKDKFSFFPGVGIEVISATQGQNVGKVMDAAFVYFQKYRIKFPTSKLNSVFQLIMADNLPSASRSFKMYYGTQTDNRPPTFKLFINSKRHVNKTLIRFLEKRLTEKLGLQGIPLQIDLVERR